MNVPRFWPSPNSHPSFSVPTLDEWLSAGYVDKNTALFAAIARKDRGAVSRLLANGADPNQRERERANRTPLQAAVMGNCQHIACDLIDAGAHPTFGMPRLLVKLFNEIIDRVWESCLTENGQNQLENYVYRDWVLEESPVIGGGLEPEREVIASLNLDGDRDIDTDSEEN
jgi:hypothetical protein